MPLQLPSWLKPERPEDREPPPDEPGFRWGTFVAQIWRAQDGRCFLCGAEMTRGDGLKASGATRHLTWTREHIYPRGGTGRGLHNNVALSHSRCNSDRGGREPTPDEIERGRLIYACMGIEAYLRFWPGASELGWKTRPAKNWWQQPSKITIADIWPSPQG